MAGHDLAHDVGLADVKGAAEQPRHDSACAHRDHVLVALHLDDEGPLLLRHDGDRGEVGLICHQGADDVGQRLLRRSIGVKADDVGVEGGGQQCVADNRVPGDSRCAPLAAYLPRDVVAAEDSEPVANGDVLKVAVELLGLTRCGAQDYSISIRAQIIRVLQVLDVAVDRYQDAEVVRGDVRIQLHGLIPL